MIDQYTAITKYYDLLMTDGYYEYESLAKEIYSIIGNNRHILELGVGTGLLAEKYMTLNPDCQFTGVDITPSMLEVAKNRLGNLVTLIEADAVTMNLEKMFDVAISNGGVWGILDLGERREFGGHVPGVEANRKGLENLARHLRKGGLLLLHLQKPHKDYEQYLSGGLIYSQSIAEGENTDDYYTLKKSYFFKKDEKILVQEQIEITCFKPETSQKLLSEAGFELQETNDSALFATYEKQ